MAKVVQFEIEILGQVDLIKNQNDLTAAIKKTNTELKKASIGEQEYKDLNKTLATLKNAQKGLRDETKRQQTELVSTAKKATGSYRQLNAELVNARRDFKELGAEARKGIAGRNLVSRIQKLDKELKDLDKTIGQNQRNVGNYASAFRGLQSIIGVGLGIDFIRDLGRESIRIFADFNQQIQTLGAIAQATDAELRELEVDAKRLGASTQFTAVQIANLQTELARLGFSPTEIIQSTEAISNLAIATQEDIQQTAKVVGQSIRAYGLAATDATRVTDIMTQAFNSSGVQLSTFAEASKLLAPIARTLGIPIEESAAAIGILADNGIEGTLATQTLGSALSRLADPTKKQAKAAKALEIEVFDLNGKFVGLSQLLKNVEERTADYTDKQKLATVSQVFGIQATRTFSTLLNAQKEITEDNTKVTKSGGAALEAYAKTLESSGQAAEAAAFVGNTLAQDLLKLTSAAEGAAIEFGEFTEGPLRRFVQGITQAIQFVTRFPEVLTLVGTAIAVLTIRYSALTKAVTFNTITEKANALAKRANAAVTAVVTGVTKAYTTAVALLTGKIRIATVAQNALNAAGKANPIGLIVGAVGLGIAAFQAFGREVNNTKKAIDEVNSSVAKDSAQLEFLFKIVNDNTVATEKRERALRDLKRLYPEFNELTEKDIDNQKKLKSAYDQVLGAIIANSFEKRRQAEIEKAAEKIAIENVKRLRSERNAQDETNARGRAVFQQAESNSAKRIKTIKKESEALLELLDSAKESALAGVGFVAPALPVTPGGGGGGGAGAGTPDPDEVEAAADSVDALKKALSSLQKELNLLSGEDSEGFAVKLAEITKAEEELNALLARQEFIRQKLAGETTEAADLRQLQIEREKKAGEDKEKAIQKAVKETGEKAKIEGDKAVEADRLSAQKQIEINAEKNAKLLEQEKETRQEITAAIIGAAELVADTAFQIRENKSQKLFNNEKDRIEKEKAIEIAAVAGNAEEEAKIEKKFDDELAAIELAQSERNKKRARTQALINGALAITNILATNLDPTGISTAIRIAASVATTAAQIAIINSQEFEKGGLIDSAGFISGPSHPKGGVSRTIDGVPVNVEGGENMQRDEFGRMAVINKKSTSKFAPLLRKISRARFSGKSRLLSNINSFNGNGVAFQQGGMVPSITPFVQSNGFTTNILVSIPQSQMNELALMIGDNVRTGSAQGSAAGAKAGTQAGITDANREFEREERLNENLTI